MDEHYPIIPGLPVVMEDAFVMVVSKPSGMLSQPGKSEDGSVLTRVLESERLLHGPVLVHRLDMDTSGLLILAKNRQVHRHLQQQFEKRCIKKRYRARLEAPLQAQGGRIGLPLRLDVENRPRQIVCFTHGKASTTLWHHTPGADDNAVTLYPLTGRTHQLRVHAASQLGLGSAIQGDRLYGKNSEHQQNSADRDYVQYNNTAAGRLMLHADYLQFEHPQTLQQLSLFCRAPF